MNRRNADRGEASTIGLAIVLVLALSSALFIVGLGSVTLDEGRQLAETESGQRTMAELDSRASFVALGGGESATIDMGSSVGDGDVSVEQTGEIRFVMRNTSTGSVLWEQTDTLGTVVYANGNDRIAYQGGGVWRRTAGTDGSVMVSPPEVHYRQGTLTLPMITVADTETSLSTARIRQRDTEHVYPLGGSGPNHRNPVKEDNQLVLFVESEYYQAWATFFERRIGGTVTTFDSNQTVRVELVAPADQFKLDSGLVSVGSGSPIDMQGSGGAPTFLDSYDSSDGNYSETNGGDGMVRSPTGLELFGNTYIKGTVNTGGTLELGGSNSTLFGDGFHQGLSVSGGGKITGETAENGTGVSIPPIDDTVNQRVNSICDSGTTLTSADLSTTIDHAGGPRYCFTGDLDIKNGDKLTIDVSDGNVSVAVDGDLDLNKGDIEVTGTEGNENTAKLWLAGDTVSLKNAEVNVSDHKSPAFRLYGKSGTTVEIRGKSDPSKFVGLLYAPSDPDAGGSLSMQADADLYGSAVVGDVSMQSGSAVHYDQALGGFTFDRQSTPASRLSYLYVTLHEVEIEER